MFHTSTVERFDCFTLVLWRDLMFHTGMKKFDVSQWYCREIRCFTLVLWRDSTFHNGTVERFDGNQCCVTQVSLLPVVQISQVPLVWTASHVSSIACVFFFSFSSPRLLIQQQNHRLYFDPFCSPYLKQTVTEGITTSNGGQQRVKPIQYFVSRYLYYNIPFLGQ